MKKLFLILFIFLLSGCSILPKAPPRPSPQPSLQPSPGSSLQPSPEATASSSPAISYIGWQEYFNEKYNYKIFYPHDWHFYKTGFNPPPPAGILLASVPEDQTKKPHVNFQVIIDKALGRDLSNYEEIISLVDDGYFKKDIIIANIPAIFLAGIGENTGIATAYIKYNDYIYRLGWNGTHPDVLSQSKGIFMKILGSFTFTE